MKRSFIPVCLCLVVSVGSARAEDTPTITITKTGPDGEIPVGKAFYVAGTAGPESSRIQPIVLRKGSDLALSGNGLGCSTLLGLMGDLKAKVPKDLPEMNTGIREASTIWEHGVGKALVVPRWDRDKLTGDQAYKILVPGDKKFFRPGFSYCLFLYERTTKSKSVEAEVRAALRTYSAAVHACGAVKCEEPRTAFEAELTRLQVSDDVVKLVNDLTDASENLQFGPRTIKTILFSWKDAFEPGNAKPTFAKRANLPLFLELEPPAPKKKLTDPDPPKLAETNASIIALAAAAASALARADGVHADIVPNRVRYSRMDGTRIRYLGFRTGGVIDLSIDAGAGNAKPLTLKADAVVLPNSSATLRDMLELSQGQVRISEYESIGAVIARITPILDDPAAATADQIQTLETLETRIVSLSSAMRRAFAASDGYVCGSGYPPGAPSFALTGPELLERNLGEWLRCEVVTDTCGSLVAAWGDAVKPPPPCGPKTDAWPGYADVERTPLDRLAIALHFFVKAQKQWKAKGSALVSTEITTVERARALDAKISFAQATWLGSYVTPVLGYARLTGIDTTLFYAGVQLHLYPNEIDEPQWTNGFRNDLRRFVALEIGFAPKTESFGPDDRYDGWSFLPPLFIGVALHPLPYASVTLGAALVDKRETTIAEESRQTDAMFYVGLNLQANVPDLIYKSLNFGLATKVEN